MILLEVKLRQEVGSYKEVATRKLVGIKLAILLEADYNYKDRKSGFYTLNYSKILLELKKNTKKFGFNCFVLDETLKLLLQF